MPKLQGSLLGHMNEHSQENTAAVMHCDECGRENPAGHKFCGSCGAPLPQPDGTAEPAPADDPFENRPSNREYSEGENTSPSRDPYDLSLFRSFSASEGSEQEPRSRYRVYIGVILALFLAGLGYKAWRSMQTTPQGLQEAPPPAAIQQRTTPPATPADAEKANPPVQNGTAQTKPATPASPSKAAKPEENEPSSNAPSAQPAADNGAQELAVARRYLSGTNGQVRDGAEAAKWLWKSIAKQNSAATLLLADIYLKGDGVPKNCDQARLLLDSAARKAVPGAGERLRNLQAFGCR